MADFLELYCHFNNATINFFGVKGIRGRGLRRAVRGYMNKNI